MLGNIVHNTVLKSYALVIARIIMAGMFFMAAYFKFSDIGSTTGYITAAGIPNGLLFAWVAAFFELALGIAFLTGRFFREAALLATPYILFLAVMFHGPSTWAANQAQFGFFVDHFIFIAGLLYMFAFGPGEKWVVKDRHSA